MADTATKAALLDRVLDAYVLFAESRDDESREKKTEDDFWGALDHAYLVAREP